MVRLRGSKTKPDRDYYRGVMRFAGGDVLSLSEPDKPSLIVHSSHFNTSLSLLHLFLPTLPFDSY